MHKDHARFLWLALGFEGGLGLLACALASVWGASWSEITAQTRPAGRAVLWGAAGTLPLLAGLLAIDHAPRPFFDALKQIVDQRLVPLFDGLGLPQLAAIAAAAGIGEELLFRGWLQQTVAQLAGPPWGVWIGIAVGAAAFGLCHWLNATYAVLAAGVGFYLGWLAHASGGILAPILVHGLYDFLALWYLTATRRAPKKRRPAAEDGPP